MSNFGSVLRKPGQKLAPKAAPKRNVPRNKQILTPVATPTAILEEDHAQNQPKQLESNAAANYEPVKNDAPATRRRNPRPTPPEEHDNHDRAESENEISSTTSHTSATTLTSTRTAPKPLRATSPAVRDVRRVATTRSQTRSIDLEPEQQFISPPTDSQLTSSDADLRRENTLGKRAAPVSHTGHRKRKVPPQGGPGLVLSHSTTISPPLSRQSISAERTGSEPISQNSVRDAIEHAREQAAAVGSLAQAIDSSPNRIQSPTRTRSGKATGIGEEIDSGRTGLDVAQNDGNSQLQIKQKSKRTKRQKKSIEQQAAEVVANATGDLDLLKRKRGATPEDLENHVIEEEEVTMGELCKDRRWGQKSETERQMQENWPEIMRRRKEERERALLEAQTSRKRTHTRSELPGNRQLRDTAQSHPRMTIVGGNIVVEQAGRELDRMEDLNQQIAETVEILEDTDIYKRVNTSTIGVKNKIPAGQNWDAQSTELFYRGLTMFGTDFMMISNMISGKSRKQVKLKYNMEERNNWARIKQSLDQKRTVDLGEYGQMAGLEFQNAADVYKQMEEDEKRLREEDEQRRRDEGIVNNEAADIPIDSIEGDGTEGVSAEGVGVATSRGGSRLESTARQTTQPKKKQAKKATVSSRRGRQATSNAANYEGTEERLGTIEEVGI